MQLRSTCLVALAAMHMVNADAMYSNPVHHGDTPDPGVAFDNTTQKFWAATTGTVGKNAFPLWSSSDLVNWTSEGYIFPEGQAPKWSTSEYWAPELHFVGGTWTVYFTALKQGAMLSVGCAKSKGKGIAGPYVDIGAPIFAETDWGNIDSTYFMDTDGQHYLIWKRDGNAIGKPTPIFLAPLSADGTKIVGDAVTLISNTLPWEGAVTEGPWVILVNGTYHLFYSGNAYNTAAYAVGVAQASKISGPYTKVPNPIAHTGNGKPFYGPGHCSVVWTGRHYAMVYHAWNTDGSGRNMLMDVITWSSGYPSLIGDIPSETPQPVP